MRFGTQRVSHCARKVSVVLMLSLFTFCLSQAHAQTSPPSTTQSPNTAQKPLMAEDAFKNVQVLRGIPAKEFMETMGFFAASLGLNCTDCHGEESAGDWSKYAADTRLKEMARRMIVMVNAINKGDFGGSRSVTCYTCHRGAEIPKVIPSLAAQNGPPPPDDPDEAEVLATPQTSPSADEILDKYVQAVGGSSKLASFSAKGTYGGYDTDFQEVPVDVFAKAPDQRAVIVHLDNGDSSTIYDGRNAWMAAPETLTPVPVLPLVGADLEGAKLDAELSFPGSIKQKLTNWRVGFPSITIDDHMVQIVEGIAPGGMRVKLYFDKDSGLLVRQVRYTNTAVGVTPTHIEYSDYRPVAGLKIPFRWTVTWVDGQSTIKLTEVQPNVAVPAAKFAKPAPPTAKATP